MIWMCINPVLLMLLITVLLKIKIAKIMKEKNPAASNVREILPKPRNKKGNCRKILNNLMTKKDNLKKCAEIFPFNTSHLFRMNLQETRSIEPGI